MYWKYIDNTLSVNCQYIVNTLTIHCQYIGNILTTDWQYILCCTIHTNIPWAGYDLQASSAHPDSVFSENHCHSLRRVYAFHTIDVLTNFLPERYLEILAAPDVQAWVVFSQRGEIFPAQKLLCNVIMLSPFPLLISLSKEKHWPTTCPLQKALQP